MERLKHFCPKDSFCCHHRYKTVKIVIQDVLKQHHGIKTVLNIKGITRIQNENFYIEKIKILGLSHSRKLP